MPPHCIYSLSKFSQNVLYNIDHLSSYPTTSKNSISRYTERHWQLYTHFKCKLMHARWRLLLDDKFVKAYRDGILIQCADSVIRYFFPRFFSYSADYPGKYVSQLILLCIPVLIIQWRVLLSCIKHFWWCLCPRCLIKKADVPQMGKPSDMLTHTTDIRTNDKVYQALINKAWWLIFKHGKKITNKDVSDLLM